MLHQAAAEDHLLLRIREKRRVQDEVDADRPGIRSGAFRRVMQRRALPQHSPAVACSCGEPFAAPAGAWFLDYQETGAKTLIRRMETGGDLPASGRIWLDPSTGHVWLTELAVGDAFMRCTIDVRYARSTAIGGMLGPAEMRERYVNTRDHVRTIGTATYGRVRKFGVQVEEQLPDLR
jgi:hypothetical protein